MTARSIAVTGLVLAVLVVGTIGTIREVAHGASGCPAPGSPLAQAPVCVETGP